MKNKELSKILELNVAQRILIVEEIWDSIVADSPDSVPLVESQKKELDKRLNSYQGNPAAGSSWNKVKERILSTI
jgi:putative addiction module component (TIGR02574 family)